MLYMHCYRRLTKNKKADLKLSDMPLFIIIVLLVVSTAFILRAATRYAFEVKVDTHKVDHFIWSERIIDSLSYNNLGRKFRGIIDYSIYKNETLRDALVLPFMNRNDKMVFKVTLTDLELIKNYEIYSDKELYDDAAPLLRLKYLQIKEIKYVLLKKDNQLKKAKLEITELYPK